MNHTEKDFEAEERAALVRKGQGGVAESGGRSGEPSKVNKGQSTHVLTET